MVFCSLFLVFSFIFKFQHFRNQNQKFEMIEKKIENVFRANYDDLIKKILVHFEFLITLRVSLFIEIRLELFCNRKIKGKNRPLAMFLLPAQIWSGMHEKFFYFSHATDVLWRQQNDISSQLCFMIHCVTTMSCFDQVFASIFLNDSSIFDPMVFPLINM